MNGLSSIPGAMFTRAASNLAAKRAIMVLFLSMASSLEAQVPRSKLPSDNWLSLFNGKDLAGWIKVGEERWEVEAGAIHGQAVKTTAICKRKRITGISTCPCVSGATVPATAESFFISTPARESPS